MSFDLELINGDLKIQPNGKIRTVTDTPKLRQDVLKIILTPLGSVSAHPWYGCAFGDEIIGKNLPDQILDAQIKASITQSLDRLKALQMAQSSTQRVSLAEMIEVVASIDVERDIDDGRKLNILVTILSKRLAKLEELFTLIS
ncbi:hypothetical protein LCGC14_2944400 [marine sediment metagenome]|uniref:Uncharacterized protein n=1 Tax=marine sediment metagenome TaxID=412755 RepID=A0A0F8XHN2_9ZZZZ